MAPNKFENNIKKTLEERQIQPSSPAWNQLSDLLDKQDQKSSKKYIWFLGIAASIIGVLFIINTFHPFQNVENPSSNSVVNTTSQTNFETETESNVHVIANSSEVEITSEQEGKEVEKTGKIASISSENKVTNSKNTTQTEADFVDEIEKNENIQHNSIVSTDLNNSTKSSIEQSVAEKISAEALLNSEVDALLKQAKSNVSTLAVSKENTHSIHANSLLEDVELDLEKSFRDKVFETLKTNFILVKTAVADRNN